MLGFLALIWALVCSVFGMFRWGDSEARLERAERRRLKEQEKLDRLQRLHLE